MNKQRFTPAACGLFAGIALATCAPSALAQTSAEDIIVTGRYGQMPDSVRTLSQSVSYADLDLSTRAGREILHRRVNLTARYLCEKLGESASSSGPAPSCQDAAVKDAMSRAGTLEAGFAPRGTTWVARSPWQPPYQADWERDYSNR